MWTSLVPPPKQGRGERAEAKPLQGWGEVQQAIIPFQVNSYIIPKRKIDLLFVFFSLICTFAGK